MGERPENFFPVGIALFCLPLWLRQDRYTGFASIYRLFGMLTVLLPVLLLGNWAWGSYLRLERDLIEGGYQVAGFALSAGAIWLGIRRHWPELVNTGVTFFVIFLYTLTGKPDFGEKAALSEIEGFIRHLYTTRAAIALAHVQSGLASVLTYATDGTYISAMRSLEDMKDFIAYMTHQVDRSANMDW